MSDATATVHGDNPLCGDEVTVQVKLNDEGVVEDVAFTGNGCSICMASASMMTLKIKNRSSEDTRQFARDFMHVLTAPEEKEPRSDFGDLRLLVGVRAFPQRVKCATLAWHALDSALTQGHGTSAFSVEDSDPS